MDGRREGKDVCGRPSNRTTDGGISKCRTESEEVCGRPSKRTDRAVEGLVTVGGNVMATLLSTTPRA